MGRAFSARDTLDDGDLGLHRPCQQAGRDDYDPGWYVVAPLALRVRLRPGLAPRGLNGNDLQ